ncbi:terminase small subunit [Thiomicrospira microaerophila]|uniref:terminase small subunit n=1 Tax=Thiomicrospira microaerophila TaxID=406020 RepID=UPI00200FFD58|nr:terminase small subunit [Thiomicrospira microaerophila]UQB42887.1 terminase small subunit [Thiomicrospira microaerophila]
MKLTGKQQHFAQAYVELGGNATEAYKQAYNAQNMKPETIHRQAHECVNHPKVSARIDELQAIADELAMKKFEVSIEEKMKLLWQIAQDCASSSQDDHGAIKVSNPSAAISAIAELNKMSGHNKPIKYEDETKISMPDLIELVAAEEEWYRKDQKQI